ncbi:MAG: DUF3078 domain-containing protein [Bacteroidota bacterium]
MVKRVGFLFALLSFLLVGKAQVLQIDSVEVQIIIPDQYREDYKEQQDSVGRSDQPELLRYFQRIDSMLPEERRIFSSSGQISIETENPYNRMARPVMKYITGLKLLANQKIEKDSLFNPYLISTNWPEGREYKPFAFSLKYRTPDYGDVADFEPSATLEGQSTFAEFLQHPLGADTLINVTETSPVRESMERLLIEKPGAAEEVWDSIPDPPEFSSNEERIIRRSVFEGIGDFQGWESPDTEKEIEKKEEMERAWKYGGTENIQFSQGFVENWAKGGENSISLLSDLRLHADYSQENIEWESYGVHKLGILNTEDKKMRVNDDLLELNSKFGLNASEKWFYSGLLNFKTQLFDGYESSDAEKENPISGFMAPAYMTMALGMDYKEKNFTLMLLPFTSKMTAVVDTVKYDQTRYKVDEDRKMDYLGGVSFVNNFTWEINEDFNLASKMDVFYEYMKSNEENQIQGEWELILDMNISVFMSARISTSMRYYSNESDKLQLKENLSISFNYRF